MMQRKRAVSFPDWPAFLASALPFPAKRDLLAKHSGLLLKDPGAHRFKLWQLTIDSAFYSETV